MSSLLFRLHFHNPPPSPVLSRLSSLLSPLVDLHPDRLSLSSSPKLSLLCPLPSTPSSPLFSFSPLSSPSFLCPSPCPPLPTAAPSSASRAKSRSLQGVQQQHPLDGLLRQLSVHHKLREAAGARAR